MDAKSDPKCAPGFSNRWFVTSVVICGSILLLSWFTKPKIRLSSMPGLYMMNGCRIRLDIRKDSKMVKIEREPIGEFQKILSKVSI